MKNILFLGRVQTNRVGEVFEIIMDHTGWDRMKVGRVTSKH